MKKLLLLFIIVGCSTPTSTPSVIGYENDNGTTLEITSGNVSSTEVVKAYFDAYNAKDLQAVYNLEHEDVILYAPSGMMVQGPKQHFELGEQFLEANPIANWEIVWSMSANVKYDDKPSENWVTSGLLVTYGKDEESTSSVSRVVDLMIVDGKVKKGYVYQRELSDSEKSNKE
jgi:hypothetical protein